MTYNLIDHNGYLIKRFKSKKEVKKYIKDNHIKNYIILKT